MRCSWLAIGLGLSACVGAAGCGTTPLAGPSPAPLRMTLRADSAEYAHFATRGTGAIIGQAFLTTRGGDVKLGAGQVVTLDPVTPFAMEWYRQIGASQERFDEAPADSLFKKARRTTTVDAQGHFHFQGLPAGTYLLRSIVSWETGSVYSGPQGGVVADTVAVGDGDQREIVLNHVVTAAAPIAITILNLDQIGSRKFTIVANVGGTSCRRGIGDPDPSEALARADLVDNAAKVHADALTNVACERGGMTFRKNCFSYIECKGDAIRWL